jgi:iron-sulfur cluster assembly protein
MTKEIIQLTDRAASYIQGIIAKGQQEKISYIGLRVSVKKGGCSGSEYDFQYAEEKRPYEEEILDKGVRLFIDPGAVMKLIGSQMDYEAGTFSSGLVFANPNEKGSCGCGKSVQL